MIQQLRETKPEFASASAIRGADLAPHGARMARTERRHGRNAAVEEERKRLQLGSKGSRRQPSLQTARQPAGRRFHENAQRNQRCRAEHTPRYEEVNYNVPYDPEASRWREVFHTIQSENATRGKPHAARPT